MHWHIVIFLVLTHLFTPPAQAADAPRNAVAFALGVTYPISLSASPLGLSPSTQTGIRFSRVMQKPWSGMVEGGMSTPFGAFLPSLYVAAGPAQAVSAKTLIGESVTWRYTPSYGNAPSSHVFGIGVAPLLRLDWGGLTVPAGLACTVSTPSICSVSVGVRLIPKIYAW